MTHLEGGSGRRISRVWLVPIAAVVAVLVAAATGSLSRSVVIDFLAWWPAWLLLGILGVLARGRRMGRVEVSGLIALLALLVVGGFTVGHLQGWPAMPSSTLRLVGPEVESESVAAIAARIDGDLVVHSAGSPFLYRVVPIRRGGTVSMADAIEEVSSSAISVTLTPLADPGVYTFAGWDITLTENAEWAISLGGDLEADLSRLVVTSLQLSGGGRVILGEARGPSAVTVDGVFELIVPEGTPVRVIGDARIPVGWQETPDGWMAPAAGEGWVVSVGAEATLVVSGP